MLNKGGNKQSKEQNQAQGLNIPIDIPSAGGPKVIYVDPCSGEDLPVTGIYFYCNLGCGRVTFYNLDSIRVCRGEITPYDDDWNMKSKPCWVYEVRNSTWLAERFAYESEFYGSDYQFGGDVQEMLTDFQHYLFRFDDQFVEAIAAGIWIEASETDLKDASFLPDHPFNAISDTSPCEKFVAHELKCEVRRNPLSRDTLIEQSRFHPQTLAEYTLSISSGPPDFSLQLIRRNGNPITVLKHFILGKPLATFDGYAEEAEARPAVETEMAAIRERPGKMGLQ